MNFLILVILSILAYSSYPAFADCVDQALCTSDEDKPVQVIGNDLQQKIESLKHCPTDEEIVQKRVAAEYQQNFGVQKVVSMQVKGFNLKGPESELKLAIQILGSRPPKTWASAAKGCDTVQCAFTKLFNSKAAAMQIFNFKSKSGYVLSLDQTINNNLVDQIWSAKEIQELDAGVSKFPPELKNLSLQKIDRMGDGLRRVMHDRNVAAFADNIPELVIYDSGARGSSVGNPYESTSWPQEVLTHEMCHHHDFKGISATGTMTSEQLNSAYKKISGWKEVTDAKGAVSWVHDQKAQFVSWYAETSPAEDYAESCMNYLLHPETLESKAPLKYAYMKTNVFHGKEFKDKPWVKSTIKSWPKLRELIADENFCGTKLASCMANLKYEWTMFCDESDKTTTGNTSIYSCGNAISQIQKNSCFTQMKKDRIIEIERMLETEENFCELGGAGAIERQMNNICVTSASGLAETLELAIKTEMSSHVLACEGKKDFTKACVLSKLDDTLKVKDEYKNIVNKIISNKVPDRMNAMASVLEEKSDNLWLKSCLSVIGTISEWESTDSKTGEKSNVYSYESTDEKIGRGYLGKYIYDDYNRDDVNTACAKNMVKSLKQDGIKVPEGGNPVNLMKKTFKTELYSFESEVLGKIAATTKKCLVFKGCKTKAILSLLETWEAQSPKQRAGFATEEYAEELQKKWSAY